MPDIDAGPAWNNLSSGHKKIQIQLYPERCEFLRRATFFRLRDSLVMKLGTSPGTAVIVASHAGTQIRVENPRSSDFPEWDGEQLVTSDGVIDISSADAKIRAEAGTACASNHITWRPIPIPKMPIVIQPVPQAQGPFTSL